MGNNRDDEFFGIANVTGLMDRGGDVIEAGAFSPALPQFLRAGFIALAHDWDRLPVAVPLSAEEKDGALWIRGRFHTTRAGADAQAVVGERLKAGLAVGLSVGFRTEPRDCLGFRSGPDLLRFAVRNGVTGLNEKSINAWERPCRLVRRVAELFEVSLVSVPMNPGAGVLDLATLAKLDLERHRLHLSQAMARR